MKPRITVLIPVYNEEKYMGQCLDSVAANDYPADKMEVFVIDGMSTDGTRAVIEEYAGRFPFIHCLENQERFVPQALNRGIEKATGEYVIRLDAHSHFPDNYFSKLIDWHGKLDADNVGCVCITDVLEKTPVGLAVKAVLSDKLGVGNSFFRTGTDEVKKVDTVPFGCYKKEAFEKYGKFDTRLIRNQDIEFNKRIIRQGGIIFLVPDVQCTYFARETWRGFAKSNYGNGLWNVLTARYTGRLSSLSLRHFVPLFFVLSLVLPLLLIPVSWFFALVSVFFLCLYTSAVMIRSVQIKTGGVSALKTALAFFILHVTYGTGSLCGVFKRVKRKAY